MIDLVVAGGGPVGLGTATLAANAGLRVVVVEPRNTPVDKACGEGLMPGAVATLRALGADPAGFPFAGIRYLSSFGGASREVAAHFTAGPGLGVRRTELHAALSDAATAAGVVIRHGRVHQIRQRAGHVEVDGCRAAADAAYLAVADGLHSPLRRQLGLELDSRAPRRYGLRQHFRVAPWSDHVEVHWGEGAEAYVTPVADDLVGVAVLCHAGAPYETLLRHFPLLRQRLATAAPASRVRGAGPLRQRVRRRVAGRALLVGDAAGYVDAITGEGIRLGLASASALVDCVIDERPEEYERAWLHITREYRMLTSALLRAGQPPWLRRRIVPAAAAMPGVYQRALDLLAG